MGKSRTGFDNLDMEQLCVPYETRCSTCGKPCPMEYCDVICRKAKQLALNTRSNNIRKYMTKRHYLKSKLRNEEAIA